MTPERGRTNVERYGHLGPAVAEGRRGQGDVNGERRTSAPHDRKERVMIAHLHLPTRHLSGAGKPSPHQNTPPPPPPTPTPNKKKWLLPVSIVATLIAVPM